MTQTAQHTSGLWTVEYPADEYGHYYLEQSAKREKCGFSSAEERAANCRLIAAAPDLLVESGRHFYGEVEFDLRHDAFQSVEHRDQPGMQDRLDPANAQAEGLLVWGA